MECCIARAGARMGEYVHGWDRLVVGCLGEVNCGVWLEHRNLAFGVSRPQYHGAERMDDAWALYTSAQQSGFSKIGAGARNLGSVLCFGASVHFTPCYGSVHPFHMNSPLLLHKFSRWYLIASTTYSGQ